MLDAFRVKELQDEPMSEKEVSVPTRIQSMLLYTHCLLRKSFLQAEGRNTLNEVVELLEHPWMLGGMLYPYIFRIHPAGEDVDPPGTDNGRGVARLPNTLPCTAAVLDEHGVYLVDQGTKVSLLVMPQADKSWLTEVFGRNIETCDDLLTESELPYLEESYTNQLVNAVVEELRRLRGHYNFEWQIITTSSGQFKRFLAEVMVEDKDEDHASAANFLKGLSGQLLQRQLGRLGR